MTGKGNRRKKIGIAAGALCLAVIALFVWLWWPRSYEQIIPAQAKAVVRLDPARLQKVWGKESPFKEMIGGQTDGIDWAKPLYAFVTPNEYIGLVAAMGDEAALRKLTEAWAKQGKCLPAEETDGRPWVWLKAGWLLTWDSRSVLLLGPGVAGERDVLRQSMTRLLDGDNPFTSTPAYKRLLQAGGDAQLFATLDALPTPYNLLFRLSVPASCDPAAVQLFAAATLRPQSGGASTLTLQSELTSENPDILQALDAQERAKQPILPPKALPDSALFALATCTDGKPLIELLRTDHTLRDLLMGLNQTIDADRMLASVHGLLTLEISGLGKDWIPTFCLRAETQARDLFADASYWMESAARQKDVTLQRRDADNFILTGKEQSLIFGRLPRQGALYFASPSWQPGLSRPAPFTKAKASEKNGVLAYFHLNLTRLFAQPCMADGGVAGIIRTLLPGSHAVTYEARAGRKATLRIQ